MLVQYYKSINIIFIWIFIMLSSESLAIDFFHHEIDYWKRDQVQREKKDPKTKGKFNWKKQLDPKNDEFFREGDHLPPKPLMELARDPSNKNIKLWFKWIEKRNLIMSRMQNNINKYLKTNKKPLTSDEVSLLRAKGKEIQPPPIDTKRFRFRLYFESSCPYCKKMIRSMIQLRNLGYYVEIKQIDNNKPSYPIPFAILKVGVDELKEKNINAWPVLFVADTDRKRVIRINGYQSASSILNSLSKKNIQ